MARDLKYRNRHVALVSFFAAGMVEVSASRLMRCSVRSPAMAAPPRPPAALVRPRKMAIRFNVMSTRRCLGNCRRGQGERIGDITSPIAPATLYLAHRRHRYVQRDAAESRQYFHKIECSALPSSGWMPAMIDMPVSFFVIRQLPTIPTQMTSGK